MREGQDTFHMSHFTRSSVLNGHAMNHRILACTCMMLVQWVKRLTVSGAAQVTLQVLWLLSPRLGDEDWNLSHNRDVVTV